MLSLNTVIVFFLILPLSLQLFFFRFSILNGLFAYFKLNLFPLQSGVDVGVV